MPTPCCQTGKLGRQKYHGPVLRTTLLGYFAIFTLLCIFPSLLFSILLSPNTLSSFLPFIFLLSAVKAAPLGSSCLGRTSGAFPVSQTSQASSSLSGLPPNPMEVPDSLQEWSLIYRCVLFIWSPVLTRANVKVVFPFLVNPEPVSELLSKILCIAT